MRCVIFFNFFLAFDEINYYNGESDDKNKEIDDQFIPIVPTLEYEIITGQFLPLQRSSGWAPASTHI